MSELYVKATINSIILESASLRDGEVNTEVQLRLAPGVYVWVDKEEIARIIFPKEES